MSESLRCIERRAMCGALVVLRLRSIDLCRLSEGDVQLICRVRIHVLGCVDDVN